MDTYIFLFEYIYIYIYICIFFSTKHARPGREPARNRPKVTRKARSGCDFALIEEQNKVRKKVSPYFGAKVVPRKPILATRKANTAAEPTSVSTFLLTDMLREAQKDTEKRQSPHAATPEHHKNLLTPSRNPLATLRPPWSLLPSRSHSTPPQGYRVANNSSMPIPARMPRPGRDLDPGPRSPGPCAAHVARGSSSGSQPGCWLAARGATQNSNSGGDCFTLFCFFLRLCWPRRHPKPESSNF